MNFLDKTGLQYFWGKIKTQINNSFAANDAMTFKGIIGTGGTVTALPATHKVGDTYKVSTAGTYAGAKCEIGDMIICVKDGSSDTASDWTIVQSNIDGAVTGPTSSTDAHVAVFNGATGKIIKDSGFTIAKSVPSNAVFTDTKVTQNQKGSSNSEYPILYSYSASSTQETNTVNKSSVTFNPSSNSISMSDGSVNITDGQIVIDGDGSNTLSRTFITLTGDGGTTTINQGKITSPMFVKSEGTSSQLLVADGSVATAISNGDIDAICV